MPRLSQRQRQLVYARRHIASETATALHREFTWLWHRLYPLARTLARKRRMNEAKRRPSVKKQAASLGSTGLWEEFNQRLAERLWDALQSGVVTLADIEAAWWSRTGRALDLQTDALLDLYRDGMANRTGKNLPDIPVDVRQDIASAVSSWYTTPGTTLQDLIGSCQQWLGRERAIRVAQTETTYLGSAVVDGTMQQLGIKKWWWQTMRDEIVCRQSIPSPTGGEVSGCRALHGQKFGRGDKMPPAHVGCRCGPQPSLED